jgi:hypothetical protein
MIVYAESWSARLLIFMLHCTVAQKRVLVAPLDWGYGHATRCIPLVEELIRQGAAVVLAGPRGVREIILQRFPFLEEADLPPYNIKYSLRFPAWLSVAAAAPRILGVIRNEYNTLKKIVADYGINGIISDNRYGLYHEQVPSVLLTHQLNPAMPSGIIWLEGFFHKQIHHFAGRFSEVWIPDIAPNTARFPFGTVSGKLSYPLPENIKVRYTGILSRFNAAEPISSDDGNLYDLAVVASGPSPRREEFIRVAYRWVMQQRIRAVWLIPDAAGSDVLNNGRQPLFIGSDDEAFLRVIAKSSMILSRSGYSSVSDWITLGRNALLMPTPGQTEQEYLAEHLNGYLGFRAVKQNMLAMMDWEMADLRLPDRHFYRNDSLSQLISAFLQNC